jgi:hypothetical protein
LKLKEQSLCCPVCQVTYPIISGIPNIHFSHSKVEKLPFPDDHFNAAFCGGTLHLFPDTVAALRKIGATMKAGAPMVVMTFIVSNRGILRSRRIREHAQKDHGLHIFELPELDGYLTAAGFESFKPQTYGSVLVFSAQKQKTRNH